MHIQTCSEYEGAGSIGFPHGSRESMQVMGQGQQCMDQNKDGGN